MKLTASRKIYALGVILFVALSFCSRTFNDRGSPGFMAALAVAGIAYLLATRELFASSRVPRIVLVVGLIVACFWQLEFLRLPVGADDDIHRYVWDGRLQRLGYNPYLVIPSGPEVHGLHTPETRNLNNPDLPSPYPPGAQLFFRAVTAIHESTFALKIAFTICSWAIVFFLLDILRRTGKGEHLVLAYAWNPLLAIEVSGSGHIDIVGALLLVISLTALVRRWRTVAAVTFGLAIAVKFLPIVLVPIYWKQLRIRVALAAAIVLTLYSPFLDRWRIPVGSLGAYVQGFRFNGPVFALLDHVLPPQLLVGLAVIGGLLLAAWFCRTSPGFSPADFAWPMAASLFFAPAVFPWYLLWLLPFLISSHALPLVVWTVSIVPTYAMWHWRMVRGTWGRLPNWVMLLEYGCVLVTVAAITVRRLGSSLLRNHLTETESFDDTKAV